MATITQPDQWLGVEVRHFAALDAVAREGSFGRAADRLGYTQSAVSQQIATLERIVGETLVERPGGPRAVSLTEAGALLLRHAEAIVARLDAARADIASLRAGETGTLRVGDLPVGRRAGAAGRHAPLPRGLARHRARPLGADDRSGALRGDRVGRASTSPSAARRCPTAPSRRSS